MHKRRIIALWLPFFATDRLGRSAQPLVTLTQSHGGLRVAHANASAQAEGIGIGMTLADGRALCPSLRTTPADPVAEGRDLAGLARKCERWTPLAAPHLQAHDFGLWLDVGGCAHLWGGERALVERIVERMDCLGYTAQAALADSPGAAWAFARFGSKRTSVIPEGATRQMLSSLPVAALRLPPAIVLDLHRLGLVRIVDLLAQPRKGLTARFGPIIAQRIDQVLGHEAEPICPQAPRDPLISRLGFADPIGSSGAVALALSTLSGEIATRLEAQGLGARRLRLRLFRVDGLALERIAGTHRPERDPKRLSALFAKDLDTLDVGFGLEAMSLEVPDADPFTPSQAALDRRPTDAALAPLLDRLGRRLGARALFRPHPRPGQWPEDLWTKAAPLSEPVFAPDRRPRPIVLFPHPRPVSVEAEGLTPVRLNARPIARACGPERIAAPWWGGAVPLPPEQYRDYWRIEDHAGGRWWLYRDGATQGWFVHGGFP